MLRRLFSFPPKYELLTLHEGVNETLAILERPGVFRTLFTNGHSMSSTSIDGQRYMRSFAHVPLLLHDAPRTAMVMCFGVGNTLAATLLHPSSASTWSTTRPTCCATRATSRRPTAAPSRTRGCGCS
jgi:spermidine synthase